uniref:Uncharacterized protein n=1 Tax=Cacopsylla melanoneura TaxID=428564 RepID=A0A8D8WFZ5_9HEMI
MKNNTRSKYENMDTTSTGKNRHILSPRSEPNFQQYEAIITAPSKLETSRGRCVVKIQKKKKKLVIQQQICFVFKFHGVCPFILTRPPLIAFIFMQISKN